MSSPDGAKEKRIYWHRELPPPDAELIGEHVVEATSQRVSNTMVHRDELWERCYREVMAQASARINQELARLGGDYAHVLDESVDSQRNDVTREAWLHGRFNYVLYRRKKTS